MSTPSPEAKKAAERIRQAIANGVLADYTARQVQDFAAAATAKLREELAQAVRDRSAALMRIKQLGTEDTPQ